MLAVQGKGFCRKGGKIASLLILCKDRTLSPGVCEEAAEVEQFPAQDRNKQIIFNQNEVHV